MIKQSNPTQSESLNYKAVFEGAGSAILAATVLILLTAILLYYTSLSERNLPMIGTVITIFSALIGGTYSSYKAGYRGLYHGLGVGIMFTLVCLLISLIFYFDSLSWAGLGTKFLLALIGGSIGGFCGIAAK